MTEQIEYRRMTMDRTGWMPWMAYHGGTLNLPSDACIQIRTVRKYVNGMALQDGAIPRNKYTVVDATLRVERIDGNATEYLACRVDYPEGGNSFDYVARETLDTYVEVGKEAA